MTTLSYSPLTSSEPWYLGAPLAKAFAHNVGPRRRYDPFVSTVPPMPMPFSWGPNGPVILLALMEAPLMLLWAVAMLF